MELRNEPVQARSKTTLERLTTAAREVVDEVGLDRLTTADVAVRAGLSIGTVYRYFPDRIAILNAIEPERAIAAEVREERRRQDAKWGEQNHPDGTGAGRYPDVMISKSWGGLRDLFRDLTDAHAADDTVTFLDILAEEVLEAFAEDDPVKLRTELIQVAAVAQQWVSAIDRRTA
ncbi:helix-turn-helix domain-containing protein [Curtobacterium sp. MCBD17_028]|uniref:helix-turn-helix domain-containing protein n=1 Tax=Curtobacterium sp. MCBD17_028 TaxID=2175670 RepID=UPI0021AC2297|nr:TetR/AcrR family transcriptional regulator [Curtobacterium sp. MCBD17_028]